MDETPVYFDLSWGLLSIWEVRCQSAFGRRYLTSGTYLQRGRQLALFTTVHEKAQSNRACNICGLCFVFFPVFKGKQKLTNEHPAGRLIYVQPKGWLDETLLFLCIKDILPLQKGGEYDFVLDSFSGHKTSGKRFDMECAAGKYFWRLYIQTPAFWCFHQQALQGNEPTYLKNICWYIYLCINVII